LATLRASQAAVTAAAHVAATGGVAYSLGRPPGHHAGRDFYGGFCYLNHAAVAAKYLQGKANGRVATLDIDYHHGNGTQEIFYSDPTVLSCSLHADPRQDYPFYWGAANERGDGDADGTNVNLPLPIGTTDAAYLKSLEKALQVIADFAPAALVVSCGFDLMAGDPVPRDGGFCITVEGLKSIARQIRPLQLPTVIVQEGGYNVARLGEYAVAVLESFD
jgi:acetoin utilization deacetylase AcuC-like enzyme